MDKKARSILNNLNEGRNLEESLGRLKATLKGRRLEDWPEENMKQFLGNQLPNIIWGIRGDAHKAHKYLEDMVKKALGLSKRAVKQFQEVAGSYTLMEPEMLEEPMDEWQVILYRAVAEAIREDWVDGVDPVESDRRFDIIQDFIDYNRHSLRTK